MSSQSYNQVRSQDSEPTSSMDKPLEESQQTRSKTFKKIFLIITVLILAFIFTIPTPDLSIKPIGRVTLAIQTVFIMQENIPFLREWIVYHLVIGIDKFYLYDNTGIQGHVAIQGYIQMTEKVNKYGFNFDDLIPYSEEDLQKQWNSILEDYGQHIVYEKWQPKNEKGDIIQGQTESINHYLKNYGKDNLYTSYTNIDQFLFSEKGFDIKIYIEQKAKLGLYKLVLRQKKFDDRFCHPGKRITQIYQAYNLNTSKLAPKVIILNSMTNPYTYSIHVINLFHGGYQSVLLNEIRFNHYNTNVKQLDWISKHLQVSKVFQLEEDKSMRKYKEYLDQHCKGKCSDQLFKVQFKSESERIELCIPKDIELQK